MNIDDIKFVGSNPHYNFPKVSALHDSIILKTIMRMDAIWTRKKPKRYGPILLRVKESWSV